MRKYFFSKLLAASLILGQQKSTASNPIFKSPELLKKFVIGGESYKNLRPKNKRKRNIYTTGAIGSMLTAIAGGVFSSKDKKKIGVTLISLGLIGTVCSWIRAFKVNKIIRDEEKEEIKNYISNRKLIEQELLKMSKNLKNFESHNYTPSDRTNDVCTNGISIDLWFVRKIKKTVMDGHEFHKTIKEPGKKQENQKEESFFKRFSGIIEKKRVPYSKFLLEEYLKIQYEINKCIEKGKKIIEEGEILHATNPPNKLFLMAAIQNALSKNDNILLEKIKKLEKDKRDIEEKRKNLLRLNLEKKYNSIVNPKQFRQN